MSFIVQAKRSGPAAAPSTWTEGKQGDETGTMTENSSTSVTLASRSTRDAHAGNTEDDGGLLAYQTLSSPQDIQLITTVPSSWTGSPSDPEDFTFFGLRITEALTGRPVMVQNAWPNVGQTRTKYRPTTSGDLVNNYATGDIAATLPLYLAITYDHSAGEVKFWESSTGVADEYNQIGDTLSLTLSFPCYAAIFGTSHDAANQVTATLTNCSVGSSITISDGSATAPARKVAWGMPFDNDGFIARSTGGIDSAGLMVINETGDDVVSITNITQANPAVATFASAPSENDRGTITGVSGMTEINDTLVHLRNVSGSTAELYYDHPIPGSMGDGLETSDTDLGQNPLNSTGFTAYSSGGQLERWIREESGAVISNGSSSAFDVRTVASEVVGAETVTPRAGTYFLRTSISYIKDYTDSTGVNFGNSGKNKPRWGIVPPPEIEAEDGKEFWWACSFYMPANWQHETGHNGAQSGISLSNFGDANGNNDAGLGILRWHTPGGQGNIGGIAGDDTHWIFLHHKSTTSTKGDKVWIDLGNAVDDQDIGNWTDIVIRARVDTSPNGILQIWKSVGAPVGGDRPMVLRHDETNTHVGPLSDPASTGIKVDCKGYKYGWHHNTSSIADEMWWGVDELWFGETARDGTGFQDVHPTQMTEP